VLGCGFGELPRHLTSVCSRRACLSRRLQARLRRWHPPRPPAADTRSVGPHTGEGTCMETQKDHPAGSDDESSGETSATHFSRVPERWHPDGFPVFLSSVDEERMDEYSERDPYSVQANLENHFHRSRLDSTVRLVERAAALLDEQAAILDVGCGEGHLTNAVGERIAGASLCGLDSSVSAVAYAAKHFQGIEFVVGDAHALPYENEEFGVVICNNLWEHVPDPLSLLAEIRRVCAPNGYLVMSTPSRYRLGNIVRVVRGKSISLMSGHHVTEYSVGQVLEQLRYGGFETIDIVSKRIPTGDLRLRILGGAISRWLAAVHSHHRLESTVFYLARKAQ
jgi:2-polyprenyl-3-methyl-5-hydroxy-6-metoxy-1,4-benzoquinol methylase